MTKYHWNIEEIRRNLEEYNKIIRTIDIHDNLSYYAEQITQNIFMYNAILENYKLDKKNLNQISDDNFNLTEKELIEECFLEDYYGKNKEIDLHMAKLYEILSTYTINEPLPFDLVALNNDELVELADTIIKSTKYQKFINFYKANKNNIDLNIQKSIETAEYSGICFHDELKNKYYINVLRNNSILDIATIVHEFFHSTISYYISIYYPNIFSHKTPYLTELEGFFADFLTADYLKTTYKDSIIISDLFNVKFYSKRILLGLSTIENKDSEGKISVDNVNSNLKDNKINLNVNINDIIDALENPLFHSSMNCFSFLCANDLFALYKKDQEKAMDELLQLSKLTPNKLLRNIRCHNITFMDDNFSNLTTTCNKLLKKKN